MTAKILLTAAALALPIALASVPADGGSITGSQDDNWVQDYHRARQHFHRGLDQFQAENYEQARESFSNALDIFPQHAEAALHLGICNYYLQDYETALRYIEEAMEKYMQFASLRLRLRYDEYDDAQERIVELQAAKQELEARQGRGGQSQAAASQTLIEIQRLEGEIARLQGIAPPATTEPVIPAKYYFHFGNCYLRMQRYNEAYRQFLQAIEVDPEHGDAHHNLAIILYMARRYDDAWLHLQLAKQYGAETNPQFEEALNQAMQEQ